MLKSIVVNLESVESMLYYWATVADREKVQENFFFDVADMHVMKLIHSEGFNRESIRKVLSAIQNRELLSTASKAEKRFWSKNMWMAEDTSVANKMAQPIKVLNLDDFVDKLNEKYPNNKIEKITVNFAPLHLDPSYIIGDELILNFFMLYFDENDNIFFEGKPLKEYIYDKLCELIEVNNK